MLQETAPLQVKVDNLYAHHSLVIWDLEDTTVTIKVDNESQSTPYSECLVVLAMMCSGIILLRLVDEFRSLVICDSTDVQQY